MIGSQEWCIGIGMESQRNVQVNNQTYHSMVAKSTHQRRTMMATQELVVPKSIPITSPASVLLKRSCDDADESPPKADFEVDEARSPLRAAN
jgi:hypothetical protein